MPLPILRFPAGLLTCVACIVCIRAAIGIELHIGHAHAAADAVAGDGVAVERGDNDGFLGRGHVLACDVHGRGQRRAAFELGAVDLQQQAAGRAARFVHIQRLAGGADDVGAGQVDREHTGAAGIDVDTRAGHTVGGVGRERGVHGDVRQRNRAVVGVVAGDQDTLGRYVVAQRPWPRCRM